MSETATSTPTESSAAPAPVPAAQVDTTSAAETAAEDAFFDLAKPGTDATAAPATTDKPAETQPVDPKSTTTPVFNDDEQKLLTRFKLDPKSPTLAAMSADEKTALLQNLRGRQEYDDRNGQEKGDLRREVTALKQQLDQLTQQRTATQPNQQPGQQPAGQQPANTPSIDDAWKSVGENLFDEAKAPATLRSAVESTVQSMLSKQQSTQQRDLSPQIGLLGRMLEELHFEQGVNEWQAPEGVDRNADDVRSRIRTEAELIYDLERRRQGDKFDPFRFTLRHATQRAASLLFNQKTVEAAQQQQADQAKNARRGSPESGQRTPATRPAITEADRENEWFDTHKDAAA